MGGRKIETRGAKRERCNAHARARARTHASTAVRGLTQWFAPWTIPECVRSRSSSHHLDASALFNLRACVGPRERECAKGKSVCLPQSPALCPKWSTNPESMGQSKSAE